MNQMKSQVFFEQKIISDGADVISSGTGFDGLCSESVAQW